MKGARWVVVAAVLVVVLVVPAVGQGKRASVSLVWLQGPTRLTSYNFGSVKPGSSWSTQFTLENLGRKASGKLAIKLTGSKAFRITSNGCKGKNLRASQSCSVTVRYAPSATRAGDRAVLKAGPKPTPLNLHANSAGPRFGHLYWTNDDGTVKEVPLGVGSVTTLASGQDSPESVAVDPAYVYWVNATDPGTVNKVKLCGCISPTVLASGQHYPRALAVDGTNVYWVNDGDGTVKKLPLSGIGTPTVLASGQS